MEVGKILEVGDRLELEATVPLPSVYPLVLILVMSRHIGKEDVVLVTKMRTYSFSTTVGLTAMLQEHKLSPTVSGFCVDTRAF